MPTYQYACTECDERFERVQAFSDPTLTVHEPGCGGAVRKLFGSVGVVFKGTGFYRNDSRSSASSSESGGSGDSSSGSDSGSSDSGSSDGGAAKTDSTPASAPAATPAATKTETKTKPAATTSSPSAA